MKLKIFVAVFFFAAVSICDCGNIRKPAVAGGFYPEDPAELTAMVDKFLSGASRVELGGRLVALICPHAGYVYSGGVAGWSYKNIRPRDWDTVVILGTSHSYPFKGAALYANGIFETPLGEFPVNEKFCAELMKASPLFEDSPSLHSQEHSVEVQLPFLARVFGKPVPIVPIVMNSDDPEECREIGLALAKTAKGKRVLLIASSDFSHYPPSALCTKTDQTALSAIETMDPEFLREADRILLNRKEKNLACILCGESAVISVMYAAKELGANSPRILQYMNSGSMPGGDTGRAVGYAAVAFVQSRDKAKKDITLKPYQKKYLLQFARQTIKNYLDNNKEPEFPLSDVPEYNLPGAVFVTLTKNKNLRGCVGTIQPVYTLEEAVGHSALSAAFEDHRFSPLSRYELSAVKVEISILSPLRKVKNADEIIPMKDGVVVRRGGSSGLFLPQVWEQIPDKDAFLSELCDQKAGLSRNAWKDASTELYTFRVDNFSEGE